MVQWESRNYNDMITLLLYVLKLIKNNNKYSDTGVYVFGYALQTKMHAYVLLYGTCAYNYNSQ